MKGSPVAPASPDDMPPEDVLAPELLELEVLLEVLELLEEPAPLELLLDEVDPPELLPLESLSPESPPSSPSPELLAPDVVPPELLPLEAPRLPLDVDEPAPVEPPELADPEDDPPSSPPPGPEALPPLAQAETNMRAPPSHADLMRAFYRKGWLGALLRCAMGEA